MVRGEGLGDLGTLLGHRLMSRLLVLLMVFMALLGCRESLPPGVTNEPPPPGGPPPQERHPPGLTEEERRGPGGYD